MQRGVGCLSFCGHIKAACCTHRRNVGCSPRRPLADIDFEQTSFGGSRQAGTSTRNRLGCLAQSCYIQCSGNDSMCKFACVQEQRGVGPPQSRVHISGRTAAGTAYIGAWRQRRTQMTTQTRSDHTNTRINGAVVNDYLQNRSLPHH